MYQTNQLNNINVNNYIFKEKVYNTPKCLHESCPLCSGTGISIYGGVCIHNIVCNCPKCSIR